MCHGGREGDQSSLIGRVRLHLGSTEGRLVNRLDRETSGIVLVAKNAVVAGELGKIIGTAAAHKEYWAIVHGHPARDAFSIDAPLGKDEQSAVAIKDTVRPDGAPARTNVTVTRRFTHDGKPFAWLTVAPESGRKHQIRIHLAHIGHPIVGDKIYGDDEQRYLRFVRHALTDADRASLLLENHALHARALAFEWRGRLWQFDAAPDKAFESFLGA